MMITCPESRSGYELPLHIQKKAGANDPERNRGLTFYKKRKGKWERT